MAFQSGVRLARMPFNPGEDLRGTSPARTSGILCREQGQEIDGRRSSASRRQIFGTGAAAA
jgi:hypothetical protein